MALWTAVPIANATAAGRPPAPNGATARRSNARAATAAEATVTAATPATAATGGNSTL